MKKILALIYCVILAIPLFSQIVGESINYKFYIYKTPPAPPAFTITDIKLEDKNANQIINANEESLIKFKLSNTGTGNSTGLSAYFSSTGSNQGITFKESQLIGDLPAGESIEIEHSVKSFLNTVTGNVTFTIYVKDIVGNTSKSYILVIPTKVFETPMIEVANYTLTCISSKTLIKKVPFDVQIIVQNTSFGDAQDVKVKLTIPANILCLTGNENLSYDYLNSGEYQSIVYSLIITDLYTDTNIPILIDLSEKQGLYSKDQTISLTLNQDMSTGKITEVEGLESATITSKSDVDTDIPSIGKEYENRFALIIGNENYSKYQTGLKTTSDVDYAINDADIFEKYAINTLGIPADNIISLRDAQRFQFVGAIERFARLSELKAGEAELFIYYAGHGFPDESTNDAYLMPVDISGTEVTNGIKIADFYKDITEFPAKKITVFLDACFSGGGRNEGLIEARSGVKIKTNENILSGNIFVFSASDAEQISQPYSDKTHGMFTYFLLKTLQESKGTITYGELADKVIDKVQTKSILVNGQEQNPKVNISAEIETTWETWKMNE